MKKLLLTALLATLPSAGAATLVFGGNGDPVSLEPGNITDGISNVIAKHGTCLGPHVLVSRRKDNLVGLELGAQHVLDDWDEVLPSFVKVMPHDLRRVLGERQEAELEVAI